jgi:hypothetical protein
LVGRCCASLASFTFISHVGFSTTILALVLDSLVRVSRRVGKNHFDKIAQGPSSRSTPSQTIHTRERKQPASGIERLHLAFQQSSTHPHAGFAENYFLILFYRFRLNDFKSFNFLSKVLFIFPSQYLFAIGFLHIFSLRRSLSPALCTSIKVHDSLATSPVRYNTTDGALTLFGGPLEDTSASFLVRLATFRLQFAEVTPGDFHCGLFPLPSPVLGESLLVSFPPLNDMLKFSGYSYFTSDAEKIWLSKHWHAETCADSTLNEFTLGSVTTALSCVFTLQSSECFHT